MRQFETLGDMSKVTLRTIGVAYELSIGTRILPWMILNCYISSNFWRISRDFADFGGNNS